MEIEENRIGDADEVCDRRAQLDRDYIADAVECLGLSVDESRKQRLRDTESAEEVREYLEARLAGINRLVRKRRLTMMAASLACCAVSILFAMIGAFTSDRGTQRAMGFLASLLAWVPFVYTSLELYMYTQNDTPARLMPEFQCMRSAIEKLEEHEDAVDAHTRNDRCAACAFGRARTDYLRIDADMDDDVESA